MSTEIRVIRSGEEGELDKALLHEAMMGSPGGVCRLLKEGAHPSARLVENYWGGAEDSRTILYYVFDFAWNTQDNRSTIQRLLDAGAEVGVCDSFTGNTSLHMAANHASPKVLQLLLDWCQDKGVEDLKSIINQVDKDGKTPLHRVVECGLLRIEEMQLMPMQLHVERRTRAEDMLLQKVALLLKYGADLEIKDQEGLTAAMRACYTKYGSIVESLLDAGAKLAPEWVKQEIFKDDFDPDDFCPDDSVVDTLYARGYSDQNPMGEEETKQHVEVTSTPASAGVGAAEHSEVEVARLVEPDSKA